MRTRIKFCGLTDRSDVELACNLGVDYIGFVFYPNSPRFVTADQAASLRRVLPSWVQSVGLFVNAESALIEQTSKTVGLDVIQFHGDESPRSCADFFSQHKAQLHTRAFWQVARIGEQHDLLAWNSETCLSEALLLDSYSAEYGGTGHAFDWGLVAVGSPYRPSAAKLIASGGLTPSNVGEAIALIQPFAVDVSSGVQRAGDKRRKSEQLMTEFVDHVLSADAQRKV